jgi:hypothetical protein
MRRRILILVAVAIVTSLVVAGASARAAAPVHEWIPIDETFTFSDCGVSYQERDQLRLHFITWSDSAGVRHRQTVIGVGARMTYTNLENGKSVSFANPFIVHKTYNADGTLTVAFTGLFFSIQGGGQHYVDSGRDVLVFDPQTGEVLDVLSSVGPSDDLCEALAAAIG